MAGGKETPRQKMIGMMYLVLTALLALNVSKEVIGAFVTINDKLDASATIIGNKIGDDYAEFDMKKLTLLAKKANLEVFNTWNGKADSLNEQTTEMVNFLLSECNDMITQSEGISWIPENGKDEEGRITHLRPLMEVQNKDNYDIPTHLFVGGNPTNPNARGMNILKKLHAYRDNVATAMATYSEGKNNWSFTPPENPKDLSQALLSANPKDTLKIAQFYKALTVSETLYDEGEDKELPWSAVTFNHAPIVAAAAMFTSLKVDVKNAQSLATEFMLDKIKEPPYYINKIEPMAMARTGYINQGDSLALNVLIAAYDSTEIYTIKWGMDNDTLPENWKETKGALNLSGAAAGQHKVKGVIGVRERGSVAWKPWEFDYTVGEPTGVVSLPEMRIFYAGYKNEIEATASGFPADKVSVKGNGCRIVKEGGKWYALVNSGVRKASVTVVGQQDDGSTINVGTSEFQVRKLPDPTLYFGSITTGETVSLPNLLAQSRLDTRYDNSVSLTGVNFEILDGTVEVQGIFAKGKITAGGRLDSDATKTLRQARGKKVYVTVRYKRPDNIIKSLSMQINVR
jgi:hypothetical protein